MDLYPVVLLLVFVSLGALAYFYLARPESRIFSITNGRDGRTLCDSTGRAVAFELYPSVIPSDVALVVHRNLDAAHNFGLGLLCGIGTGLLVAKVCLVQSAGRELTIWHAAWILSVALVWSLIYLSERLALTRIRSEEAFVSAMASSGRATTMAVMMAGRMRDFRLWLLVILFGHGSLLAVTSENGVLVAVLLATIACLLIWASMHRPMQRVSLDYTRLHMMPVTDYIKEGGWVAPTGLLLACASIGLVSTWRVDTGLMLVLLQAGIMLTAWAERTSRARHAPRTQPEWNQAFEALLAPPAAPEPLRVS